jgi:hypothetical protein
LSKMSVRMKKVSKRKRWKRAWNSNRYRSKARRTRVKHRRIKC